MKLVIDGVLQNLDLAIVNNENEIISTTRRIQNKNLSEILVQEIENILIKSKINKNDIKQLYIVNGPGSFTSLKIISIFVNVWKMEKSIELYAINTCLWNLENNSSIVWFSAKSKKIFYLEASNNKNNKVKICNENLFNNKIKHLENIQDINCNNPIEKKIALRFNDFKKVNKIYPNYIKKGI